MIIHDLSTDGDDPPAFVALRETRLKCANGADYSGPRGDKLRKNYPEIVAPTYAQSPAVVFKASAATAQAMGWAVTAAIEDEGRIEATATTRLLRFKDDVVIRLRAQDQGTGEINYEFLFAFLDGIGYSGWIGCEYKPLATTDAGLGWVKKYL